MAAVAMTDAGGGVWLAGGRDVNWTLLVEGTDVVVVDAGYPAYAHAVVASLEQIGRSWSDVVAVLVTHAHVDHVGGLRALLARRAVPVYAAAAELPNLHGERHQSAGPADIARHLLAPGVLPWALRISRAGATAAPEVGSAQEFDVPAPVCALDLPGRPIPVATAGHTSGHTCYLLPAAGAVVTGDTLCTGHALSRVEGPQLLPPWFDHDRAGVVSSLDVLAGLEADVVLPGHGPLLRTPIVTAVAQARARL